MTPTLAITGAGGFVGAAVLRALRSSPTRVRALCNRRTPTEQVAGVEWLHGGIDDSLLLAELLRGADVAVHLAGPPSVADSFRWPTDFVRIHVEGTTTLLEACRRAGVRRVVYLSSAEVYGSPRADRVSEDHPCEPRSPYGAAKLAAELLVRVYASAYDLEALVLRAFSIYGPGQSPAGLLEEIRRQAARQDRVQLADLRPVRDFCHVDDVALALVAATRIAAAKPGRVYNIGTGRGISVGALAQLALTALQSTLPIGTAARTDRPAAATVTRLVADPTRARSELGWQPSITLEAGLRALFATCLPTPA